MAEPRFTPRQGVGAKYKDPQSGEEYVFTSKGWQRMKIDAAVQQSVGNTFVVKPDEEGLEAQLLQGGADPENARNALMARRRILANNATRKTAQQSNQETVFPPVMEKQVGMPFAGMTKTQVIRDAFNKGMTNPAELGKLSDLYDMLVPEDTTALSAEDMGMANSLRAEYIKVTGGANYLEARQMYQKIQATGDTPAGDISMIFAYMKLLDPSSTVRESEQELIQNATSYGGQVERWVNQIAKGRRLTKEMQSDIRAEASKQYKIYKTQQDKIDSEYSILARQYGLDPSLLKIGLYDSITEDSMSDPLNMGVSMPTSANPLGL